MFACASLSAVKVHGATVSVHSAKAEVVSGDIRGVVGSPKASLFGAARVAWSGRLDLGKLQSSWRATYDSRVSKRFLRDVALSGDGVLPTKGPPVQYAWKLRTPVQYAWKLTVPFAYLTTPSATPSAYLKLTTTPAADTKLTAEYDSRTPDTIKSLAMVRRRKQ